jgi:hypothetical protein
MCNNIKAYYYTLAKTIKFQSITNNNKTICLVNKTVAKNNLQSTDTQLLTETNHNWMVSIAPTCLPDIYHSWPSQHMHRSHSWNWENKIK